MLSVLCYPKANLKQNMKTILDKTRSYYVFFKDDGTTTTSTVSTTTGKKAND